MDLLNRKVKHKTLGVGTIIAQDGRYITIEFAERTSKFSYPGPDTFAKFLQAEEPAVQAAIRQEIADAKAAEEVEKRAAEEVRRCAEEERQAHIEAQRAAETAAKKATKTTSPKRVVAKQERIPGKRMTFYVFQGSTYDQESHGGYIWAPISNKAGSTFHHWDRLLDVHPGDIILHGYNGYIQAVSTARGECYVCNQPEELRTEDLWDQEGRRVDCDYILIKNPVKTSMFIDDILRLCNVKYSPFDKDGNGNMGYLFEINRELARIFLRGSAQYNDYLNDIEYIRDLLSEADDD